MSVGSALLRWAPTRYAMPARDRAASAASAPAWTPVAEQREPALALAGSR